MIERYLLYIDILDFSRLVTDDPARVSEIFRAIDNLNVHRHDFFETIVFSDTVLVYNPEPPHSDDDRKYIAMYLCEFAQDLQLRLVGERTHFRGVIVHGGFEHYYLNHIQCFYGPALIEAYKSIDRLPFTGLLISKPCDVCENVFPTEYYSTVDTEEFRFVYLNQCLEALQRYTGGVLPLDPFVLEETDDLWLIRVELAHLRDTYRNMTKHENPHVRAKHLATWQMYRLRYRDLLDQFEEAGFKPDVICPSYDWSQMWATYDARPTR